MYTLSTQNLSISKEYQDSQDKTGFTAPLEILLNSYPRLRANLASWLILIRQMRIYTLKPSSCELGNAGKIADALLESAKKRLTYDIRLNK